MRFPRTARGQSARRRHATRLALEALESRCLLSYTITDLGTLGGTNTIAFAVNNSGQVVGTSRLPGNRVAHAFLYDGGTMTDLGTLGGTNSEASGINDSGQVVGTSDIGDDSSRHAFLYDGATLADLGTLGGNYSAARGINDLGYVVGFSTLPGESASHAFFFGDDGMADLGTLGGRDSSALAINNRDQVVGEALTASRDSHAFRSRDGVMADLGTLGGASSTAYHINNLAQAVGESRTGTGEFHAFLSARGVMTDLGSLGGASQARGINDSGQIVGVYEAGGGHPFLYQGGAAVDLNSLLPPASGWELIGANAINNAGQIVGSGMVGNETHGYLLTPDAAPGAPPAWLGWALGLATREKTLDRPAAPRCLS